MTCDLARLLVTGSTGEAESALESERILGPRGSGREFREATPEYRQELEVVAAEADADDDAPDAVDDEVLVGSRGVQARAVRDGSGVDAGNVALHPIEESFPGTRFEFASGVSGSTTGPV